MNAGDKVRFVRAVERYPFFIVKVGMTGTVQELYDRFGSVKLDERMPGAEQWGNCVHWSEVGDMKDDLEDSSLGCVSH